ncbi:MAG TPA: hypothetical protein VGI16_04050 [Candidatus Acidoferrum sp.]|jgi:hypothetical protein
MTNSLSIAIADLSSADSPVRRAAAAAIYRSGRAAADSAVAGWWKDAQLAELLLPGPTVTVGVAVQRETFALVRAANGSPRLADVPPDQDAEEFELHFSDDVLLDVLTSREPGGTGAIAKYLAKFGEGVQQVEFRCSDVRRATQMLVERFGIAAIYPRARPGADGALVNFFLVPSAGAGKVLIELYEH